MDKVLAAIRFDTSSNLVKQIEFITFFLSVSASLMLALNVPELRLTAFTFFLIANLTGAYFNYLNKHAWMFRMQVAFMIPSTIGIVMSV